MAEDHEHDAKSFGSVYPLNAIYLGLLNSNTRTSSYLAAFLSANIGDFSYIYPTDIYPRQERYPKM
jgi:hypothetical protein